MPASLTVEHALEQALVPDDLEPLGPVDAGEAKIGQDRVIAHVGEQRLGRTRVPRR